MKKYDGSRTAGNNDLIAVDPKFPHAGLVSTATGGSRIEYATKPITFEYSRSRTVQIGIFVLILVQVFLGLAIFVGGFGALFYCTADYLRFAGTAPVGGGIYLILSVLTGFYTFKDNRLISLGCSIINFFLAFYLTITETLGAYCASLTDENRFEAPCRRFIEKANMCILTSFDIASTMRPSELIFIVDPYLGGRISVAFCSTLALVISLITVIAFVVSNQTDLNEFGLKYLNIPCQSPSDLIVIPDSNAKLQLSSTTTTMSGEAVYLYHKKTKTSYTVGDSNNVVLAFENEEKNMEITKPSVEEAKRYDERRATYGGRKLITSTLQSFYNTSAFKTNGIGGGSSVVKESNRVKGRRFESVGS
uniref:Uncharacterized protein n=1 Tax=Romanomermis culicivorax TaxID=13658 RepID=A0A915KWD8_ROMCU